MRTSNFTRITNASIPQHLTPLQVNFSIFMRASNFTITKYDLRDSRLSCLVNLFQVKGAVSEETTDDWFEHKLNNALKRIEQISDESTDNIYNVITTRYETKLTASDVSYELGFESRTEMKLCCGNARFVMLPPPPQDASL